MAAQLTLRNIRPARRDIWWVYIAMISLPVPLSPRIRTGISDLATSCAWASTSRMRLLERTKEWPFSRRISLGSLYLFGRHEQMLGDGYFKRIIDERLQDYAACAESGEDLVVRHLGRGGQDKNRNFGTAGADARKERHRVGDAVPGQQDQAGTLHRFEITKERLLVGEKPQIVEQWKRSASGS